MKKLVQSSLLALASVVVFSCSPGKQYYQFPAKDSAYGYKAPEKEVAKSPVELPTEAPATPAQATAAVEIPEANAADQAVAEAPADAAPAAQPSPAQVAAASLGSALVAASAASVADASPSETKAPVTKAEVKKLKKDIKGLKKKAQMDSNLRMALILALVAIIAGALTGIAGLGVLMGIISGLAGLGALIFFVLWLLDQV